MPGIKHWTAENKRKNHMGTTRALYMHMYAICQSPEKEDKKKTPMKITFLIIWKRGQTTSTPVLFAIVQTWCTNLKTVDQALSKMEFHNKSG